MIVLRGRKNTACCLLVAALAILLVGNEAFAQRGGSRAAGRGRSAKEPAKTGQREEPAAVLPGPVHGKILKFKPLKEGDENESIAGYLLVRPFEKGARTLKVAVAKPGSSENEAEKLTIKVGEHAFEVEDYGDLFWKGLYCTATWDFKGEKSRLKELKALTFDPIEVVGKVDSIEDDVIILNVKPKDGSNWPHLVPYEKPSNSSSGTAEVKKVRSLKAKLKSVEDVTKMLDADGEDTSLSGFEQGQAIEATIVYSQKVGILIRLAPPNTNEANPKPPSGEGPDRGRPPPPPRGTRRGPRGGG